MISIIARRIGKKGHVGALAVLSLGLPAAGDSQA